MEANIQNSLVSGALPRKTGDNPFNLNPEQMRTILYSTQVGTLMAKENKNALGNMALRNPITGELEKNEVPRPVTQGRLQLGRALEANAIKRKKRTGKESMHPGMTMIDEIGGFESDVNNMQMYASNTISHALGLDTTPQGGSHMGSSASTGAHDPLVDSRILDSVPTSDESGSGAHKKGPSSLNTQKNVWTPEEDEALRRAYEAVRKMTNSEHIPWTLIAKEVPGRTGKQCRGRWVHHLAPNVEKQAWTAEEDARLYDAIANYGTQWAMIAKMFPGRTDQAVKNRYYSARRRLVRKEKREKAVKDQRDRVRVLGHEQDTMLQPQEINQRFGLGHHPSDGMDGLSSNFDSLLPVMNSNSAQSLVDGPASNLSSLSNLSALPTLSSISNIFHPGLFQAGALPSNLYSVSDANLNPVDLASTPSALSSASGGAATVASPHTPTNMGNTASIVANLAANLVANHVSTNAASASSNSGLLIKQEQSNPSRFTNITTTPGSITTAQAVQPRNTSSQQHSAASGAQTSSTSSQITTTARGSIFPVSSPATVPIHNASLKSANSAQSDTLPAKRSRSEDESSDIYSIHVNANGHLVGGSDGNTAATNAATPSRELSPRPSATTIPSPQATIATKGIPSAMAPGPATAMPGATNSSAPTAPDTSDMTVAQGLRPALPTGMFNPLALLRPFNPLAVATAAQAVGPQVTTSATASTTAPVATPAAVATPSSNSTGSSALTAATAAAPNPLSTASATTTTTTTGMLPPLSNLPFTPGVSGLPALPTVSGVPGVPGVPGLPALGLLGLPPLLPLSGLPVQGFPGGMPGLPQFPAAAAAAASANLARTAAPTGVPNAMSNPLAGALAGGLPASGVPNLPNLAGAPGVPSLPFPGLLFPPNLLGLSGLTNLPGTALSGAAMPGAGLVAAGAANLMPGVNASTTATVVPGVSPATSAAAAAAILSRAAVAGVAGTVAGVGGANIATPTSTVANDTTTAAATNTNTTTSIVTPSIATATLDQATTTATASAKSAIGAGGPEDHLGPFTSPEAFASALARALSNTGDIRAAPSSSSTATLEHITVPTSVDAEVKTFLTAPSGEATPLTPINIASNADVHKEAATDKGPYRESYADDIASYHSGGNTPSAVATAHDGSDDALRYAAQSKTVESMVSAETGEIAIAASSGMQTANDLQDSAVVHGVNISALETTEQQALAGLLEPTSGPHLSLEQFYALYTRQQELLEKQNRQEADQ